MGRFGILQSGARTADGASQGADRFVLRDDALVQLFFDAEQLLRFFFFNRGDRHAGPTRDHVFDIFAVDDAGRGLVEMIFFAQGAQVLALFPLLVGVEARLLELVVRDGVFHAMDDELDALLDFGQFLGKRSLAQLHARSRFVNEVDGLVRKEAIRDIAVRVRNREIDGVVGVGDGVELLVAVFDPEQES